MALRPSRLVMLACLVSATAGVAAAGEIRNNSKKVMRISDLILCSTADCRAGSEFQIVYRPGGSPEDSKDDFDLGPGESFAYQWTGKAPLRGVKVSTKDPTTKTNEHEYDVVAPDKVINLSTLRAIGPNLPDFLEIRDFKGALRGLQGLEFDIVDGVNPFLDDVFFSTTPLSFDAAGVMLGATPYTGRVQGDGELTISVVPEPATWALLILGFGATGGVLRRRALRGSQDRRTSLQAPS